MKFEDFLTEAAEKDAAYHRKMAEQLKAEANKLTKGGDTYLATMSSYHYHLSQAEHKSGNKAAARDHAQRSYGYSN